MRYILKWKSSDGRIFVRCYDTWRNIKNANYNDIRIFDEDEIEDMKDIIASDIWEDFMVDLTTCDKFMICDEKGKILKIFNIKVPKHEYTLTLLFRNQKLSKKHIEMICSDITDGRFKCLGDDIDRDIYILIRKKIREYLDT